MFYPQRLYNSRKSLLVFIYLRVYIKGYYTMANESVLNLFAPGVKLLHEIKHEDRSKEVRLSENRFTQLQWSPNGQKLALAEKNGDDIWLWNKDNRQQDFLPTQFRAGLKYFAWSPDSLLICNATWDRTILVQDSLRKIVFAISINSMGGVSSLAWSQDNVIAVGSSNGLHLLRVNSTYFSHALSARKNSIFGEWSWVEKDANNLDIKHTEKSGDVQKLCFSPNSKYIAVGAFMSVTILDVDSFQIVRTINNMGPKISIKWSPNSEYIAIATSPNYISIYDANTGAKVNDKEVHGYIQNINFSYDSLSTLR